MTLSSRIYDGSSYTQAEFAEFLKSHVVDGVVSGIGNGLIISAQTAPNMTVNMASGRAIIQGYWYDNDGTLVKTISTADPTNPRIDRIVLRLTTGSPRNVVSAVLTGTPAPSPVVPSLTQTSSTWEISLAQIAVAAGAVQINPADITDERLNRTTCGMSAARGMRLLYTKMVAAWSAGSQIINNLLCSAPAATDAVTKGYVNTNLASIFFAEIVAYAGNTCPGGWLECNGQSLSTTTYAKLFANIGYTFGGSGGSFNVPNLNGATDATKRFIMGYDSGDSDYNAIGKTGGEATHALVTAEIPSHTHTATSGEVEVYATGDYGSYAFLTKATGSAGGGAAHNNLPPYADIKWIIRGG